MGSGTRQDMGRYELGDLVFSDRLDGHGPAESSIELTCGWDSSGGVVQGREAKMG
jgi:hypothetical protein